MSLLKAGGQKKLKTKELKWECDLKCFDFESTNTVKPIEGIIGQERAIKALKIGVDMRSPGYNIFISGLSGTGKYTTIQRMLESIRPQCPELYDYAYVNNFEDEDRPLLLQFPAGNGVKFKKDLGSAIKFLKENIPQVLQNEPFVSKKKKLVAGFTDKQQTLMQTFENKLRKDNFTLGQVKVGEMARPEILAVVEEQPVFVNQLDELVRKEKLTQQKAKQLTKKYATYQDELQTVFRESLKISQNFQEQLTELEEKAVADIINITIGDLKKKYKSSKVEKYLDQVIENVLFDLDVFKGQKPVREETESGVYVDYLKNYDVNILLDNSKIKECPVIIDTSPTYNNLFGTIEKYTDGRGGWFADFTRIKAGSLLRANGGYLVINATDAFTEPGVWKALKRVMLYGKLEIQDFANVYLYSPSIIKPEPIEINTKIILMGNNYIFSVLSSYEDDFNKIFKIKAEFDYEMKRTTKSIVQYSQVIKKIIASENLSEFTKAAIGKIIEYGARYAGEKDKLTTRFAYIADLTREANFWAKDNGDENVTDYHVDQAFDSMRERHGLYETKLQEMFDNNTMLIDTGGKRVGQVNGLAVYSSGFYSFGKPTRITASASLGNGNIINVERESGLSGNTHNKGMLIISGYFKEKFGSKVPLSFSASLVFEQGYGPIDGDSASITEICALLSALSGIPIKQSFAITGSVNQKGDIQPIGGVNEKIEGFFDVCKSRGLNKNKGNGVIIPVQNIKDLMLKKEVVDAVESGKFAIYSASKVEDAVELLTGIKAGSITAKGHYEVRSVFGQVEKRLKEMRDIIKPAPKTNKKPARRKKK
ncbi:MAG: AAA family ATPase [Melioribacteraceae bacterium]|nr:AAA family ATPase [Melioribacteraceae bacterium]MCF8354716.1 AAA family ATPase [Melioribacteraceae bacterium]MCF8394345.1 AAA family ATPase [Melioribacteraceae bacterium]MCF8420055.1 AAA family ATPase [Melioribacteraceae bacterium]